MNNGYKGVLAVIVLILPSWLGAQEYQLFHTMNWQQGGVINAIVYPNKGIESVQFRLEQVQVRDSGGSGYIRAKAKGFPLRVSKLKNGNVYAVIMGISALVPADDYELRASITLKNGETKDLVSHVMPIKAGAYTKQVIKMGAQGQSVRNNQSQERQLQAQRFYAALGRFDEENLFDVKPWDMPIKESKWYYTSRYGSVREFVYPDGGKSRDFHNGEDFAGMAVGTNVYSVAQGHVVLAENRIVTGNTVIVMHAPGVFSLYYHMDSIRVKKEEMIQRGEIVGTLGSTGFATGPHLHLTAYIQGQDVDPSYLLNHALWDEKWAASTLRSLKVSKKVID
ncbi:M23 family metallopeptidase [Entomospira entomophila]|uniref:M23 family metallopeptidase n=1 Tax=Entomospira entomophila TaxID=2719988 RepID=A0A968KU88_9SPIO|nr:M23 family metallopeptidase [Entomospira entomophilus]NIZ41206.1 M23 family metallopeptidase [Entomospira entomophilus]WDI35412.1 M23 family metallopeptidase [Entomospira entomophilus]